MRPISPPYCATLVDKDAILCTDGARVYQTVARELSLTHCAINVQQGMRVVDGAFHIQNVNAYDSRLKQWQGTGLYGKEEAENFLERADLVGPLNEGPAWWVVWRLGVKDSQLLASRSAYDCDPCRVSAISTKK
jgi:hypothetical protein